MYSMHVGGDGYGGLPGSYMKRAVLFRVSSKKKITSTVHFNLLLLLQLRQTKKSTFLANYVDI